MTKQVQEYLKLKTDQLENYTALQQIIIEAQRQNLE